MDTGRIMGGSGVNYGRPPNQQTYVARRTYIATSVSMIFIIAYLALRISVYLFTRRGPKGERERLRTIRFLRSRRANSVIRDQIRDDIRTRKR